MDSPRPLDPRRVVPVVANRREASDVHTLSFHDPGCQAARPGQYVMAWVPGIDEVPLSLSTLDRDDLSAVTIKVVGPGTDALCAMQPGDTLGIRGPYGNEFTLILGRVAIVGGGTGLAPLLPLTQALVEGGSPVTFIAGGATKDDVLFRTTLQTLLHEPPHRVIVTTEDHSEGRGGTAIDAFHDLLDSEGTFEMVYSCGPEPMMRKVFDLTERFGLRLQVCMERIVHCSLGLCGSCAIGRFRVCKDGLILSSDQLREVADEFGVFTRGLDGRKTYFRNK